MDQPTSQPVNTNTVDTYAAAWKASHAMPSQEPAKPEPTEAAKPADSASALQKPAAEIKTADSQGEPETSEQETEQAATEVEATQDQAERKTRLQKRFDRLHRDRHRLAGEKAQLEKRTRELEQQLVEARTTAPKPAAEQAKEVSVAATDDPEPDPNQYDGTEGKGWADYTKALAAWSYRQEAKKTATAETEKRTKARQDALVESFQKRLSDTRLKHEDFDAVVGKGSTPLNAAAQGFVLESEHAGEILYFLSKNPGEAARIASLGPYATVRQLVLIEQSLAPKPETKLSASPAPPAPIAQVGASGAEQPRSLAKARSVDEYERLYRAGKR